MSYRKEEGYRYDERRDAAIARALSHASRIRILRQLRRNCATAEELADYHDISRYTLAKHIRTLILARLIRYQLIESVAVYSLNPRNWPRWLSAYIDRTLPQQTA